MSTKAEKDPHDYLVELFMDYASWFGQRIPLGTRGTVLNWVLARLSNDNKEQIRRFFRCDHDEQDEAERALAKFFQSEERPTIHRRDWSTSVDIKRTTDWGRTYTRSTVPVPSEFSYRKVCEVPDERLLLSLAGLAKRWLIFLEKLQHTENQYSDRIDRLRNAVPERFLASARHISFGRVQMRRLRRCDPQTAAKLEPVRRFWSRKFGTDDKQALRNLASEIKRSDIANDNTLLELVAALSVIRSAVGGEALAGEREWTIKGVQMNREKYPSVVLGSGQLRCEIAKGQPSMLQTEDGKQDRLIEIFRRMGLGSTGQEPDILLRFWHLSNVRKSVFALGDAKRNESHDGDDYMRRAIKGTAAAYMASFGHLAGLRITDRQESAFEQKVEPVVTLFFHQGVDQVAGIPSVDSRQIVDHFNNDETSIPPVVGFDRQHMGQTDEESNSQGHVLNAWFRRIVRSAEEALNVRRSD